MDENTPDTGEARQALARCAWCDLPAIGIAHQGSLHAGMNDSCGKHGFDFVLQQHMFDAFLRATKPVDLERVKREAGAAALREAADEWADKHGMSWLTMQARALRNRADAIERGES